ncbi:MAG: hypothetical protein RBT67_16180 [Thauera sp.]|jgi:hypothetical protein|nr:hypothetical protein [Thauera sp.]
MTAPVHATVKALAELRTPLKVWAPTPVELAKSPLSDATRKHPPYGRELATDPPPADESLRVLVGWDYAKIVTDNRVIVLETDDPQSLRFDAASGRSVRVDHPHDADPAWLLSLAQALIDRGAAEVRLTITGRPEAFHSEVLRIVPKGAE